MSNPYYRRGRGLGFDFPSGDDIPYTDDPFGPLPGETWGTPPPANTGGVVYVVKAGDTLARIAAAYRTTVQAIAQANGIANVNRIYVGQRLTIPGATAATPPQSGTSAPNPNRTNTTTPPPQDEAAKKKAQEMQMYLLLGGAVLLVVVLLATD